MHRLRYVAFLLIASPAGLCAGPPGGQSPDPNRSGRRLGLPDDQVAVHTGANLDVFLDPFVGHYASLLFSRVDVFCTIRRGDVKNGPPPSLLFEKVRVLAVNANPYPKVTLALPRGDAEKFRIAQDLGPISLVPSDEDPFPSDEQILLNAHVKTDGEALLQFFRERTLPEGEREKVKLLIKQLGSKVYREREQAAHELVSRGPAVIEPLRAAMKAATDLELIRRAELCLQRIEAKELPVDVRVAVVRLSTVRKPAGAIEVLLAFMPFTNDDRVADEVLISLRKLGVQGDKTDPALLAALADKHPVRRAAAGEILVRAEDAAAKAAARKLLDDPQPLVRWRLATALAFAREKEAIPILINLLPELTLSQAWQTEDILFRLAEDKAPPAVSVGTDEASRKKSRDAWAGWYATHQDKIDLARLTETPRLLGHTIVVLLDLGQVVELNAAKEVRWQVDGLVFPLDVQFLPADRLNNEDRILVAEYHASRVTERTLKGDVKWQKRIAGPLAVQRLPNGNTFIATDSALLEYDKNDNEVLSIGLSNGERIMKAMKLPNGDIVCLSAEARIVRLDKSGKELYAFPIKLGQRLFGGRIHMLQSGRVLVPHNAENKVIEYDTQGKEVWSVEVEQPVAATRLPNGNTLVTTMLPNRGAIEFDRNGREVWSYRTNTRVTRALRR